MPGPATFGPMSLVVDASVAVKWLVPEEKDADLAERLRTGHRELYAPRLMAVEVGNAIWVKARRGSIDRAHAGMLAARIARFPVVWFEEEAFAGNAVRLALDLDVPIYDCVYLALARRLGARLATADVRFARAAAAGGYGGDIAVLAEWAGERP